MSKDLIIVESPAKVRTIKKFLGKNYAVEASVGHIRDLPTNVLGVDEENDFAPQYQIIPGKNKVVSTLRSEAAKADQVFLAPDPDREGEAIAWHVAELIRDKNANLKRIQFNEITARAVKEALENPRPLDEKKFFSQQARRILDRLVGYKISPLLWNKVKRGLSAGRVQSVALRLIVERERERQAFVPEEYWALKARFLGQEPPEFETDLFKFNGKPAKVKNAKEAKAIEVEANRSACVVDGVEEKERSQQPRPPFITSTLQQEANSRLNYSAKRTMSLAQRLYEGVELGDKGTTALITYMRTDSVRVSKEAVAATREWITTTLGKDYCPAKERSYKTKASSQDAHEAIRPVNVELTPEDVQAFLPADMYRLYASIWRRFVASQMAAARFWDTHATVSAGKTQWKAKGQRLIFSGFLKVYGKEEGDEEANLPALKPGDLLELKGIDSEQKFTQPPARYSEASLIRKLEEKGIGRPSTYAAIISTLVDRDYVALKEKHFLPSELGFTVSDLLVAHFPKLMDVDFTAGMETSLDEVAEGKQDWVQLLKTFSDDFGLTLAAAQKSMVTVKGGVETGLTCETCGKPLVIKFGKNGSFIACSGYPECKNTKNFTRNDKGDIVVSADDSLSLPKVGICPECKGDLLLRKARTGSRFIACAKYPDCRYTKPFSTGVACPREGCSGEFVEKSSRKGKVFYACNKYPECTLAVWDWPVLEPCPKCDSKILVKRTTKERGEHLACPSKTCRYWRALDEDKGEESE